jgi:hypothetical protein
MSSSQIIETYRTEKGNLTSVGYAHRALTKTVWAFIKKQLSANKNHYGFIGKGIVIIRQDSNEWVWDDANKELFLFVAGEFKKQYHIDNSAIYCFRNNNLGSIKLQFFRNKDGGIGYEIDVPSDIIECMDVSLAKNI